MAHTIELDPFYAPFLKEKDILEKKSFVSSKFDKKRMRVVSYYRRKEVFFDLFFTRTITNYFLREDEVKESENIFFCKDRKVQLLDPMIL